MKNWIGKYGTPMFQEGGMMPEEEMMGPEMEGGMEGGMDMEGGDVDVESMIEQFISALESGDMEGAKDISLEVLLALLEGGEGGEDMMDSPEGDMEGMEQMGGMEEPMEAMKGGMYSHKPNGRKSKYAQNYMKGGYSRAEYNDDPNMDGGSMKQNPGAMKGKKTNKYARGGNAPRPMTALEKFEMLKG